MPMPTFDFASVVYFSCLCLCVWMCLYVWWIIAVATCNQFQGKTGSKKERILRELT